MAGVINIGADNASDQFYRYKMPKLQARVRSIFLLAGYSMGQSNILHSWFVVHYVHYDYWCFVLFLMPLGTE